MRGYSREIEYPDRYEAAVEARIHANARTGRRRRWLAADPTRQDVINKMYEAANHAREGSFIVKMVESYDEWGSLTGNQEAAVRRIVEQNAQRDEARAAARAEEAAHSQYVGTVGERREFTLTIKGRPEFEGNFGTVYIHICHDPNDNVVIYKGGKTLGERGETVRVKATVKAQSEREGVKQTIISRPVVVVEAAPAPEAPAAPATEAATVVEAPAAPAPVAGGLVAMVEKLTAREAA